MCNELQVTGLTAGYGKTPVLSGFSASCQAGGITALLGSNGAGKTTLLRAIVGCLRIQAGAILLGDLDLVALSPRERARHVALVPQVSPDTISLRVAEAVGLARYPQRNGRFTNGGSDNSAVQSALAAVELETFAQRRCSELSGGEWRRVLVAQGLAQEPRVLLLDEPVVFLDPPARRRMLHMLRELADERQLVVLTVLHDIDLAKEYAAQALLLRDGKLLAAGTPGTALTSERLGELYECDPCWLEQGEGVVCG